MSETVRRAVQDAVSELLREPSAGRVLGVKANTLRKWRQLGIGPDYIRLSHRCVRYRREDLMRFLESRRVTPRNGENV
jgi:hypothetical protein